MPNETNSSINWGLACHAAGLSAYMGLPVLGSLAIWLAKRKTDAYANDQGREAVNFNLSFVLYAFVSGVLCAVFIGYPMLLVLSAVHLSLVIWATLKANKRENVRYPFTLRFIN